MFCACHSFQSVSLCSSPRTPALGENGGQRFKKKKLFPGQNLVVSPCTDCSFLLPSKVSSMESRFSHNLADNVQVSEVRVEEVSEQSQQPGSVSETVSRVLDELDGLRHRLLQLDVLLVTVHRLQRRQRLQSDKARAISVARERNLQTVTGREDVWELPSPTCCAFAVSCNSAVG